MSPLGYTIGYLGIDSPQADGSATIFDTEAISFAGSGIVFNNTYTTNVTQAYKNAILAAEQDIAAHWTNAATINITFDAQAQGRSGTLASNGYGLIEGVSYTALKAALVAHDANNPDAQAAVASRPATDPSGGVGWSLPIAYARFLGLTTITPTTDDTVLLNTSYAWTYGQDVVSTVEHEITEGGMGRVGALGKNTDNAGHALWSTMDLFRYSAPGVHDYTDGQDGKATFFSADGSHLLLQFNNQYSGATHVNGGDTADYIVSDVFGTGSPGDTRTFSITDLENMNVLGWTPVATSTPVIPPPPAPQPAPTPTATGPTGPSPWHVAGAGDVNADSHGDILWQNDNGQAGVWLLNGTGVIAQTNVGANFGPTWHVEGAGDFNGDGKADMLWQNDNGQPGIWLLNGTTPIAQTAVGNNPGTAWHIKGDGDFDGDGKTDILWQNDNGQAGVWLMNGTTETAQASVGGNPGLAWHAIAAGDFDGDHKADILWQNDNGQVGIWLMSGTIQVAQANVGENSGPAWHAIATGDFNGDGKADILWQNDNGQAGIWLMNGTTPIAQTNVGANPGSAWHVLAAADFNGDGKADILWQNDNGQAGVWLMNGTTPILQTDVGFNPDAAAHGPMTLDLLLH